MLKRDISITFVGNAVTLLLGVCTAAIFARVLGPSGRGLLALAMLVPSIAATFLRLGQETVNITFAGLYKEHRSALFLQSIFLSLLGGVGGFLVISAFYFLLPIDRGEFAKLSTTTIWLTCIVVPVSILATIMLALVRGVGRIAAAAFIQIGHSVALFAAALLLLVVFDFGLNAAVLAMTFGLLVTAALSIFALRDYACLNPSKLSGKFLKKSLGFGTKVGLATFATFMVYRLDQGVLGYKVSSAQLGLYVVAVGLAERTKVLPRSISMAFLPRLVNELSARQEQVPQVFRYSLIVTFLAMLVVAALGVPAIIIVFGWDYAGSIVPFLILLPGIVALGGSRILAIDILAREKPIYSVITSFTTMLMTIVLLLLLIPFLGIAGAALASTITYISALVLRLIFYKWETGRPLGGLIPRWEDFGFILSSAVKMVRSFRRTGPTEQAQVNSSDKFGKQA